MANHVLEPTAPLSSRRLLAQTSRRTRGFHPAQRLAAQHGVVWAEENQLKGYGFKRSAALVLRTYRFQAKPNVQFLSIHHRITATPQRAAKEMNAINEQSAVLVLRTSFSRPKSISISKENAHGGNFYSGTHGETRKNRHTTNRSNR